MVKSRHSFILERVLQNLGGFGFQCYLLQSKDSLADPTVCTQKYGSLRTKTWQDAEVVTQEVMAERRSI